MKRKLLTLLFCSILSMSTSITSFASNYSVDNYNVMLGSYNIIPQNVRENFENSDWSLILTDEQLEDTLFKGINFEVCAGTDYENKRIELEDSYDGAVAIVHEMGHYVYFNEVYYNEELTEEWNNIYLYEGGVTEYANTNILEGFAEAYKYTYMYEDYMEKYYPQTFVFCRKISELLEGVTE